MLEDRGEENASDLGGVMASEVDRSWATSRPRHRRHRRTWSLTCEAPSATSKEQVSVAPMGLNDDDVLHELAPAALVSPVGSPPRYSEQLDGGRHEDSGPARASKQNLATSWRFRMHLRRERDLASSREEADMDRTDGASMATAQWAGRP